MIRPLFQLTATVIALFRCSVEHFLLLVQHISIVPLLHWNCRSASLSVARTIMCSHVQLNCPFVPVRSRTEHNKKENQSWLDSFSGQKRWDRDRCDTSKLPQWIYPLPGLCVPTAWSTRAIGSAANTSTIRPIQRESSTTLPLSLPDCSRGHPSAGKSWSWQSKLTRSGQNAMLET